MLKSYIVWYLACWKPDFSLKIKSCMERYQREFIMVSAMHPSQKLLNTFVKTFNFSRIQACDLLIVYYEIYVFSVYFGVRWFRYCWHLFGYINIASFEGSNSCTSLLNDIHEPKSDNSVVPLKSVQKAGVMAQMESFKRNIVYNSVLYFI